MDKSTGEARPRPGSRAEGAEKTREQVVAAARTLLIKSGYRRLTMEQVAKLAGITRVTIYRQFGSKLGLLEAVAEDLTVRGRAEERITRALAVSDASGSLRALVCALCEFWSTDPPLFRRMVTLSSVDPDVRRVLDTREQWRYEGIVAITERLAAEDGLLAPFGPEQAAALIAAMTSFSSCDQIASALAFDIDEVPALLLPLLDGIVRSQPARGSRRRSQAVDA
jgi:AcrR family transcriptional regulator